MMDAVQGVVDKLDTVSVSGELRNQEFSPKLPIPQSVSAIHAAWATSICQALRVYPK